MSIHYGKVGDATTCHAGRAMLVVEAANLKLKLQRLFFETQEYIDIRNFLEAETSLQAATPPMAHGTKRGICLFGPTGCGKTRTINEAIYSLAPRKNNPDAAEGVLEISTMSLVSTKHKKNFLEMILHILSDEPEINAADCKIDTKICNLFKKIGAQTLYFDDFQDLTESATDAELKDIAKGLRFLLKNKNWPVSLVIASSEDGNSVFECDESLKRLFLFLHQKELKLPDDMKKIAEIFQTLCQSVADFEYELETIPMLSRHVISVSCGRLGMSIELIIDAIVDAVSNGESNISYKQFARVLRMRGVPIKNNPFLLGSTVNPTILKMP